MADFEFTVQGFRLNNSMLPPEYRTQIRVAAFMEKIEQMAAITVDLDNPAPGTMLGQSYLTAEQQLRDLRGEAKPLEAGVTVVALKQMSKNCGLSSTGKKAELIERIYNHVDYFHTDHSA
ncbi:expressed unknown protein [Seminavis robusta]|uniref:SAP domain-containing protein n=1 Tax=Seminavis robusta TaxID=568900 RepID=A0A9N8DLI4_9STRA|nr:expressed unknown protein [Seminavis robusta]|eukprot:Sro221_g090940.1 n/a (120) ;mRNA; r:27415-27774